MPWSKIREHADCPTDRPWAVVKDADGSVEGCHPDEAAADRQLAALNAAEGDAAKALGRTVRLGPGVDLCVECAGIFSRDGLIVCDCDTMTKRHGDPTGVILGLWLPEPLARSVALPPGVEGGLPWELLHVTLAFLGRRDSIQPAFLERLLAVVPQMAGGWTPILAEIGGLGLFPPTREQTVSVYAPVDSPDLPTFRHELTSLLDAAGVPYSRDHGFSPHVTLGEFPSTLVPPIDPLPSMPFEFGGLTLAIGPRRIEWPFLGAVDPLAVAVKNRAGIEPDDVDPLRGLADSGDADAVEALNLVMWSNLGKREFSQEERDRLADEGKALPGGGFPIVSRGDLRNAVQALGRAENPEAARRHIIRRARALDALDLLPDDWDVAKALAEVDDDLGGAVGVTKRADEDRFTFGPLYVPEFVDAHGDYSVADDLQKSVWDYVRLGDRRIRQQHTEKVIGEWVELAVWPESVEASLIVPDGDGVAKAQEPVTFPAGTPFMGVVWSSEAWPAVRKGLIRGYSVGGRAKRLAVDVDLDG